MSLSGNSAGNHGLNKQIYRLDMGGFFPSTNLGRESHKSHMGFDRKKTQNLLVLRLSSTFPEPWNIPSPEPAAHPGWQLAEPRQAEVAQAAKQRKMATGNWVENEA